MAVNQSKALREAAADVLKAATLLEAKRFDEAGALAEKSLATVTQGLDPAWLTMEYKLLVTQFGSRKVRRGQTLARALWVASTVDDRAGRSEQALARRRRAMELYARLRMTIEELDLRAARELGAAGAKPAGR